MDIDTPALIVDLDILERNLDAMARLTAAAGVKLRPHTKTHKSPCVARMQLERGAAGIAVSKLGEAEVMAQAGITDILIAYPILGEAKLRRLAALCRQVDLRLAVDSVEAAGGLARLGRELAGQTGGGSRAYYSRGIPVYLEVDTGLHRMGLDPGEPVLRLAQEIAALGGLDVLGVMGHAGHTDQATSPEAVADVGHADAEALVATAELLRANGFDIREVAPGSTPAARFALDVPGVTEIRPGTYVYNDVNTVARWAARWDDCATTVVTTVVSRPAPDRAIIDAGSKVLSSAGSINPEVPGFGYIVGHPELSIVKLSEEHGIVRAREEAASSGSATSGREASGSYASGAAAGLASLKVGDRLAVVPNHVCTAVAMFDEAYGIRGDRVEMMIPISARGRFR